MRSDTQLDYAVFQLTPTRTRCELLVAAQGKTHKLASGLLKPFIAHLRTAEEQVARGGYSIRLEPPEHCLPTTWFTKGTMERFVRFVSTPEVLERVSMVETELLELEEASRIQESNVADEIDMVEDPSVKLVPSPSSTRVRYMASSNVERHAKLLDAAENAMEGNTKQCLLRALDARRLMLQKEQGMSFARAIAAGFSIEYMDDLVSFAECFGADRLREACIKFIALCKKRQESGLWQDDLDLAAMETARVMGRTDDIQGNLDDNRRASFPIERMASAGESVTRNHIRRGSLDGMASEHAHAASAMRPPGTIGDYSPPTWSNNGVEYMRGHPVMAAWPGQHGPLSPHEAIHHSSLYGFPRPGMPYPQHLGNPYMQAPYAENNGWQMHAPSYWPGNHSTNAFNDGIPHGLQQTSPQSVADRGRQGNAGGHQNYHSPKNDGDEDKDASFNDRAVESETRRSLGRSSSPRRWSVSPRRKGRSGSKRSGMVVIRNINYITPNPEDNHLDTANNDAELSTASSDDDDDDGHRNGMICSKAHDNTGIPESRNGCSNVVDTSLFVDRAKMPASTHDPAEREFRMSNMSSKVHGMGEKRGQLIDNMFTLKDKERTGRSREIHSDILAEQGGQGDKRISASHDSFILPDSRRNLAERDGRISDADFEFTGKANQPFQQNDADDSFIVYNRIVSRDESNVDWRTHLNLESEVPGGKSITDDAGEAVQRAEEYFEPDDLFMIPERNKDTGNRSWNTPVDYDLQALAGDVMDGAHHGQEHDSNVDPSGNDVRQHENKELKIKSKENMKALGKETKARTIRPAIVRPGKPNPLVEAQLRADKLRAYKADLQKSKKEKEDEDRKRIEDLKRQRQERIASRSSANAGVVKSPSTNRTIGAAHLNANSRSSLSTPPWKLPTSSPRSGAPSFMSPRTRDLFSTKPSRATENVVRHSVPNFSELRKERTKTLPVRASAVGSQLQKNGEDTYSLSVQKTSSHMEGKRGPLSLTTVIRKGATAPTRLAKESKVEGSALPEAAKTPTVVNKQEKQQTTTAVSKKQGQTTTSNTKKPSTPTQREVLINTEGSKMVQEIDLPVPQEHTKQLSAREGVDHPHDSKEEKAYVQIRAPESSEKEITGTCTDVKYHQSEVKCAEGTSEKSPTLLEEYSMVNAEQTELEGGSLVASLRLLPLSTALDVEQSKHNGDTEGVCYEAPLALLSTDEKSFMEEKELSGMERYSRRYALMSLVDFDKEAVEFKDTNKFEKPIASYGSLDHPISDVFEHSAPPYAPPTDSSPITTPSKDSPSLLEAIQQAQSAEADSMASKSRKKWSGDGAAQKSPKDHSAKGLKKLLLLGRKSSRSPVQTSSEWIQGSMASEECDNGNGNDEEDEPSSCKSMGVHYVGGARSTPPDGSNSGGKLKDAIQTETTPTKSSRSFFSLPTFRSKGEGKA